MVTTQDVPALTSPTFTLEFLGPGLAFSRGCTAVMEQDRLMPQTKWIIERKEEVKSIPL